MRSNRCWQSRPKPGDFRPCPSSPLRRIAGRGWHRTQPMPAPWRCRWRRCSRSAARTGGAIADLLESILGLERRHWRQVLEGLAPGDRRETAMRRGMSQVTALGGVADQRGLRRLLQADGHFGVRAPVDLPLDDLRRLYGAAPDGVAPLEPDLIGEHEILLSGDEDMIAACRAWIASLPEQDRSLRRRTLFTVLQRAARPDHGVRAAEAEAFLSDLLATLYPDEVPDLIAVAVETPGPLPRLLSDAVPRVSAEMIEAIFQALPEQSVAIAELADRVAERRLLDMRKRIGNGASQEDEAAFAVLLINGGFSLGELGRREAALAATEEGLAICRRLTEARPEAFEQYLGASLHNLSGQLSDLGQLEAALAASEEAVAIRCRLAEARPDAFKPGLAGSLGDLSRKLSDLGRCESALAAIQQAVAINRLLAEARPDAFEPNLSHTLTNLGAQLSHLGQWEAALAATEEAVMINRRLAEARPDKFEPSLAVSLHNLGDQLFALGRREAALAASEEAVAITRRLSKVWPDAFEPNLASSLGNLGNLHSNLGHREAALAASEEARAIYSRLADARPDAFEPLLAKSLSNLSVILYMLGQGEAALTAGEEAVGIRRRLVEARREVFEPDLAASLDNLSGCLFALGRVTEAIAAASEGIALLTPYHARLPAAHQALMNELTAVLAKAKAVETDTGDAP
ncbi:tetratricopeptide repeat protein [Paracoccus aestuarii]|uniref:Tetratricopeptide repeat protein n=2 Tax=Paracoccus aestuarii TaxID=453842 RepID=A0A419A2H9_9RHOB|nr:tetratricopeptide repeat protein [Paracoccus aestuarii]